MNKEKLKQNYKAACNAYLKAFCDKHDYEYDIEAWAGGDPGGIALIADYYVVMASITVDFDTVAPEEEFIRWYDYCLRAGTLNLTTPNFRSWLKGCPVRSDEELAEIENGHRKIDALKGSLEAHIEYYNKTRQWN
jgi:hypothetical protein